MIAISSVRIVRKAKHPVHAKGRMFHRFTSTMTDSTIPAHMMIKSRIDQNHSFTLALRFSG